jgi:hypothetical protein
LNPLQDIDATIDHQKPNQIINELEDVDRHINIKQGTKFENGDTRAHDEFFRSNNYVKNVAHQDDILKEKEVSNIVEYNMKSDYVGNVKNEVLPYRTIEVIFNKKNIYVNKQHPNPVGICFDIYDKNKWLAVLNKKDGKSKIIHKSDIPHFYSFRNFVNPYPEDEILLIKKKILKSLSKSIREVRLQKNLPTNITKNKEIIDMLDLYLIFYEMKDLGISSTIEHKDRINEWYKNFKTKLPNKIRLSFQPLFYNHTNEGIISTHIEENCAEFLKSFGKNQTFMTSCKIFEYPNRIMSVRIVISVYTKISENDRTQQDSDIDDNVYQMTIENDAYYNNQNRITFEDENEKLLK